MDETESIVDGLESGDYQRQQITLFESWATRHGHGKKEIAAVKKEILSGEGVYFDLAPGEPALRHLIRDAFDGVTKIALLGRLLFQAENLILRYAPRPLSKFELKVAVKMRFIFTFDY